MAEQKAENVIESKEYEAKRVHERSKSLADKINDQALKSGETAIRNLLLVNGGAAISVLAFMGGLVAQARVSVAQLEAVSDSLLWFAAGVASGAIGLLLAYFTNWFHLAFEASRVPTWNHPYLEDGPKTSTWRRWAYGLHIGAVAAAILSLLMFVIGLVDVRGAIVRLGQ